MEAESLKTLTGLFEAPPSAYWLNHYQFSRKSTKNTHTLGKGSVEAIIVNTVIPLWAAYARRMDDHRYMDRALSVLEQIPAEENSITGRWADLGMPARNSFDTQGLIELFNTFCQRKECLQCAIGASLLRPPDHEVNPAFS